MENTKRARRRERRSNWSTVEVAFCGLALFLALMMTISGISRLVYAIRGNDTEKEVPVVTVGGDGQPQEDSGGESTEEGAEPSDQTGQDSAVTDSGLTQYSNDSGYGGQLYQLLDSHPEAAYILRNLDLYPEQLLTFVLRYPEAMPFGASYLDFDRMGLKQEIDLSQKENWGSTLAEGHSIPLADAMPLLLQWDTRWGYENYGDGLMGCSGCGPTCLSMVSLYLTGWHDNDPLSVANFAQENGYYVSGSGTSWSLMSQACINFGLNSTELPLDESKVISALEDGHPVICAMGEGIFTDNGHYIVLVDYSDGSYTIRDPNSPEKSAQTWTFDQFKDQIRNLWSFEAA